MDERTQSRKRSQHIILKQQKRDFFEADIPVNEQVDRKVAGSFTNRELYHAADEENLSTPVSMLPPTIKEDFERTLDTLHLELNNFITNIDVIRRDKEQFKISEDDIDSIPFKAEKDHVHTTIQISHICRELCMTERKDIHHKLLGKRGLRTVYNLPKYNQFENYIQMKLLDKFNAATGFEIESSSDEEEEEEDYAVKCYKMMKKNNELIKTDTHMSQIKDSIIDSNDNNNNNNTQDSNVLNFDKLTVREFLADMRNIGPINCGCIEIEFREKEDNEPQMIKYPYYPYAIASDKKSKKKSNNNNIKSIDFNKSMDPRDYDIYVFLCLEVDHEDVFYVNVCFKYIGETEEIMNLYKNKKHHFPWRYPANNINGKENTDIIMNCILKYVNYCYFICDCYQKQFMNISEKELLSNIDGGDEDVEG